MVPPAIRSLNRHGSSPAKIGVTWTDSVWQSDLAVARGIKSSLCLQLAVIDQVVHALHDGVFADRYVVAPARIQNIPHDSRHLQPSGSGGRQDERVEALRKSAGKPPALPAVVVIGPRHIGIDASRRQPVEEVALGAAVGIS